MITPPTGSGVVASMPSTRSASEFTHAAWLVTSMMATGRSGTARSRMPFRSGSYRASNTENPQPSTQSVSPT